MLVRFGQLRYEFGYGSGVDGAGGESDAGGEVGNVVGGDEDGGGVEQDDVAAGAFFSGEDCGEDLRRWCGRRRLAGFRWGRG